MNDRASEFGAAPLPGEEGELDRLSAGDMLRMARESHGLDLDVVAAALKVPPRKLAALEADDIDALPDPVFARALAASVCRALRVDPAPVLAKLPGAKRAGLADADRTISRNLRTSAPRSSASGSNTVLPSRALLAVVVLLLIGTAAMFWLPQSVLDRVGGAISSMGSGSDDASDPTRSNAGGSLETVTPALPSQAGTAASTLASTATPGTPATPAPVPPVISPAPPPVEVAPPPVAADLLVLKAREDSWIAVSEAGGKSLLRRTLKAGESVKLNGTLPLSVVVGRANGIDAQVRGKPFDLAPVTGSGGVARFEVKS